VKRRLVESPGTLSSDARRAIVDRDAKGIPATLKPYLEKVFEHAYRVDDEDVAALKRAGVSEDEIFEATAAAALAAALLRLDAGMNALRGASGER
jgi:hypothetical protein